jgi:hypothetical protein
MTTPALESCPVESAVDSLTGRRHPPAGAATAKATTAAATDPRTTTGTGRAPSTASTPSGNAAI